MNRNQPLSLFATTIATVFTLVMPTFVQGAPDTWVISQAKPADTRGVTIISGNGDRALRIEDPEITVVDDSEISGGKALSFSGFQCKPVLSSKVHDGGTSAKVKVMVKPAADVTDQPQTILVRPGAYEFRYYPKRQEIELLVSYKEKAPPMSMRAALTLNQWNTVEASMKEQVVTLTVNGKESTGKLPEGGTLATSRSYLRLGSMDQGRPFKGLLADISVEEPAE